MQASSFALNQDADKQRLRDILLTKKMLVCCGAGGVGKTTTAAALGVGGALAGRRVLVLTIDPARRLAEALGMPPESQDPCHVPLEGVVPLEGSTLGTFDFWMVQPFPIFDAMIKRLAESPEHAERLAQTTIYQAARHLAAGMQEYMAGESLYQFFTQGRYDLIILDTPPSRNAIEFLNAPDQLLRFLDSRILRVFAPSGSSNFLFDRARKLVVSTFERLAGNSFLRDIQEFVGLMLSMFDVLQVHADTVKKVLASGDSTHLLVTSTDSVALEEALYFQRILRELSIPFGGFLLNRSLADNPLQRFEDLSSEERQRLGEITETLASALTKLSPAADQEKHLALQHRQTFERLRASASKPALTVAAPHLGEDIEDLPGLIRLARLLLPS